MGKMWQDRTKLFFLCSIIANGVNLSSSQNCNLFGTLSPEDWETVPNFGISGCPGSYFQINILPQNENNIEFNYVLSIENLLHFENETISRVLNLALFEEDLAISVKPLDGAASDLFVPFTIEYREVANSSYFYGPGVQENATIELDSAIEPNKISNFVLNGYGKVHRMDLSWTLPDSSGILALQRENGRITLFTNPTQQNLKVAVVTESQSSRWTLLNGKRPESPKKSSLRLKYNLGPAYPVTTTPKPTTTTTKPPDGSVTIYVVAVNEMTFVDSSFTQLWSEILALAQPYGSCKILKSSVFSCRSECSLTTNANRGCVKFAVTVESSIFCQYSTARLKSDMEEKLSGWKNDFDASRINLDDCLTPAQVQWISMAILVPIASIAFVVISFLLFKKWKTLQSKRRVYRRHELENMRESRTSLGFARHARNISQFQIIEEEDE